MPQSAPLKLLAEDGEDLSVISAALQDAVGKIGDISYEPIPRRLTVTFNRYRWEAGGGERVRSALQLSSVLKVQGRRLRREAPDAVVQLLALSFEAADPPGGAVVLTFAGGGDLRCEVECIDALLVDVSAPWPTPRKPSHEA